MVSKPCEILMDKSHAKASSVSYDESDMVCNKGGEHIYKSQYEL